MPFDINAFRSGVDGLMPRNRFEVSFGLPQGLRQTANANDLYQEAGRARITCESAPMPGAALQANPVRRYGYGFMQPRPYGAAFTPANMVFRADTSGRIYDLLHAWQMCAVNIETRDGMNDVTGPLGDHHPYELGYLADYAVDITITAFDQSNDIAMVSILKDAYPLNVVDTGMSWASRNEYMRIEAAFAYSDWFRDTSLF